MTALFELGKAAEREERYQVALASTLSHSPSPVPDSSPDQDAVDVYTRILNTRIRDGDAWSGLGRAYLNLGQWAKGGAAFNRGWSGPNLNPNLNGLLSVSLRDWQLEHIMSPKLFCLGSESSLLKSQP